MRIISFKNERIYYKGNFFTVILGPYSKHKFLVKFHVIHYGIFQRDAILGRFHTIVVIYVK